MNWQFHTFESLNTYQLFELMKLRTDVFVVEQQCAYPELDDQDTNPHTIHLLGLDQQTLAAYARAMPVKHQTLPQGASAVRIGRVVLAKSHRGTGLAHQLMKQLMSRLEKNYPNRDQILSAQTAIVSFYESLGFEAESESYLEDGIPHVDMRRQSGTALPS